MSPAVPPAGGPPSPRQRFLGAFEHREGDRVPVFDVPNNPALFLRELGEENPWSEGVPHVRIARSLGMDACLVPDRLYTALITRERDWRDADHFVDELGVIYAREPGSWPLAVPQAPGIRGPAEWERVRLPDPRAPWRHAELHRALREAHSGDEREVAVLAGVRSAFAVLYISMGLESLSLALYDRPEWLQEMSRVICDHWTEVSLAAVEAGADGVYIANDMGMNSGTLISPADLRRIFLPDFARQVERIRATGARVILHSCGNIEAILEDLVEIGIDGYNNLQVAAGMDIAKVKGRYGDRLTLIGNVDCPEVMRSGDPARIEQAVKDTLAAAAPGGGYVIATDHSFHQGVPLESVDAFLEAAHTWGRYPLRLGDSKGVD